MRHEIFDRWLTEDRTVDYVIEHLIDANFDPEFYRHYEKDIANAFNDAHGTRIKTKKKSLRRIFTAG
jgi:hypothetical protein